MYLQIAAGTQEVAVFGAASETFSRSVWTLVHPLKIMFVVIHICSA